MRDKGADPADPHLAHGTSESRLRPAANAGLRVRGDVRGVDGSEWCRQARPASIDPAACGGVTNVAVPDGGKFRPALDKRSIKAAGLRRRYRIDGRAPSGSAEPDRSEQAKGCNSSKCLEKG